MSLTEGTSRTDIPEDIWQVQHTTYRIILPLIILTGILFSGLSITVLSKPKLRTTHVNTYFFLLSIADLLIFLVSIPTVKTLNGCRLHSYDYALYFAHGFFTIFYIIQTFALYIILWISYDRFLAVWNFQRFNEIQKPKVIRVRLVCTLLICILMHVKHMFDVEIFCSTYGSNNENKDLIRTQVNADSCHDGRWVIDDGLHFLQEKAVWDRIFWVIRGLVVSAIPIMLVVALNLGIIWGILHQYFHATTATSRTQRRDLSRIYIILAISATFISCTIPLLVHAAFYADNVDNCHGPYAEEIFRGVANMLILVEHVSHFIILCFNDVFWLELKKAFSDAILNMKNTIQEILKKLSKKPNTKPDPECNDNGPSLDSPVMIISPPPSSPPLIKVAAEDERKVDSKPNLQVQKKSTELEIPLPTSDSLQVPRRSPTASMVTLEDFL